MTEPRSGALRTGLVLAVLALWLSACATSPVAPEDGQVAAFGPAHVLSGQAGAGERVIWGGRIASIRNLTDHTELTVISYPLDRGDRPRVRDEPGVRFVLRYPGFLEPVQHAPGRFLTVLGSVAGVESVAVGEHALEHPVLDGESLHLWPADLSLWQNQTRFSVGVGISL